MYELPPLHPAQIADGDALKSVAAFLEDEGPEVYLEVCQRVALLGPAQCGVDEVAAVLSAECGLGPAVAARVAAAFADDLERLATAARARLRQKLWQAANGEVRMTKDEQALAMAAARETLGWAGSQEIQEIKKALREAEKEAGRK